MTGPARRHDRAILDALEAIDPEPFGGQVWRVTRQGRDPLRGSSSRSRWSPGSALEVLYTSLEKEGALTEVGYRLSLEPVWPSLIKHHIHLIEAQTERTLQVADLAALARLGVDVSKYQSFDYSVTQAIAAAAHFLEFDGLIVPSARAACSNLVLFLDRASAGNRLDVQRTETVDWESWRKRHNRT